MVMYGQPRFGVVRRGTKIVRVAPCPCQGSGVAQSDYGLALYIQADVIAATDPGHDGSSHAFAVVSSDRTRLRLRSLEHGDIAVSKRSGAKVKGHSFSLAETELLVAKTILANRG